MDALLAPIQDLLEGQIDFEGQHLTELLSTTFLVVASAIALAVGYIAQDIYLTLWVGLAGLLLIIIVVVPPWPAFNQHPEPWLPSGKGLAGLPPGGIIVEHSKN